MDRAVRLREQFIAALRNARTGQRELLARLLATNADTTFGREHGFAQVRDLREYRRAVPIRPYAAFRPLVDRALAGERNVLTAADPVLYFATAGTTGAPKRVPVVREAFNHLTNNQVVYWGCLADRHPAVAERDDAVVMLHLAPRPFTELSATGVPILNPTHIPAERNGIMPYARAPWFPPPAELGDAERLYFFLRHTIEHDLRGFACLHPSRMPGFAARLAHDAPRLVQELHDGTVCGVREGAPNPTRAAELERLAGGGALVPRDVWPNLEFIACWYGGSFKLYAPSIVEAYGARLVAHMSASSEAGHITLPIDGEPMDGPLTVHANFYEFIPVDDSVEDATSPEHLARCNEATLTCDELELGGRYELVLTSPSGLYRYAPGDRFEVQGFVHGVPRIGFIGRGGIVDMTGEKISEQHVQAAIDGVLGELGLAAACATCCAVFGTSAHYVFVFEPRGAWPAAARDQLAGKLDGELRRMNSRYELKRSFGDLAPPRVELAASGAFERHRQQRIAAGAPATQLKDKLLHADPLVLSALLGESHVS
jgi:hypothetical protein